MPLTTLSFGSLDIVCFLVEETWQPRPPAISFFFPGDIAAGLSERQSRTPQAEAALLTAAVELFAEESEAQALRTQLATLGKDWVGLPIYADTFDGADAADLTKRFLAPQCLIDLTAVALVAGDAALTAGHLYAPLLVGHITELPPLRPAAECLALCSLTVTEDSPWDFRIGVLGTHTSGTWPAALLPDWSSPPVETPVRDLAFERIGHQREQTIGQEERAFYWTSQAGFTLVDKTEIAALLGFFIASRGQWAPFDAPMWWTPASPTTEAPHASKFIFGDPALKLEFTTAEVASARLKFVQVPWEVLGTAGEEPQRPARIFLYQFTHEIPDPQVYRFTNCWRPLVRTGDGTYAPAPMEHEKIGGGLDLANENVLLNSFLFAGNPLGMFNPCILEGPLSLVIFEIETDPIDPDAAVQRWSGRVLYAPQDGRKLVGDCRWLGGLLDQEIPRVRMGPVCNTFFLSAWCGHLKAAFAKSGTFDSATDNVIVVACADAAAANTYAPGKVEVGSGATWESRAITASAPVVGGQQLTLDRPIRQAPAGQAVVYLRSCDRSKARCKELDPSGWQARFRGMPNLPLVNLSIPDFGDHPTGKK